MQPLRKLFCLRVCVCQPAIMARVLPVRPPAGDAAATPATVDTCGPPTIAALPPPPRAGRCRRAAAAAVLLGRSVAASMAPPAPFEPELEAAWRAAQLREHWRRSSLVALAGVVVYGLFCIVDVAAAASDPVRWACLVARPFCACGRWGGRWCRRSRAPGHCTVWYLLFKLPVRAARAPGSPGAPAGAV